jgi:hypothetical protein
LSLELRQSQLNGDANVARSVRRIWLRRRTQTADEKIFDGAPFALDSLPPALQTVALLRMATLVNRDDVYVLNYSTKYLARDNTDARHNYGQYASGDQRARIAEAWRFPIVDSYYDGNDYIASYAFNCVTFIYADEESTADGVAVVGTFSGLHTPIPLRRVDDTKYWTVSVAVPKGEVHRYKFLIGGRAILDPVNPQRVSTPDGGEWSRFFTQFCTQIISFEEWESVLLQRLTAHILPFRTTDAQRFLDLYYNYLDRRTKDTQYERAYRLDQAVGAVSFIDKIVAREEAHRLVDYKTCLEMINRLLRQRNPYEEPSRISTTFYAELYEQLAGNEPIRGWDYSAYGNPRFFLQLLRRHTYTGAFSHPKYGGNAGAAGWAYLAANLRDPKTGALPSETGQISYFDWEHGLEKPLGRNPEYHG